jgi:hypothetical protein
MSVTERSMKSLVLQLSLVRVRVLVEALASMIASMPSPHKHACDHGRSIFLRACSTALSPITRNVHILQVSQIEFARFL